MGDGFKDKSDSMDGTEHPIDSSAPRKTNKFIFTNEDLPKNFVIINSPSSDITQNIVQE